MSYTKCIDFLGWPQQNTTNLVAWNNKILFSHSLEARVQSQGPSSLWRHYETVPPASSRWQTPGFPDLSSITPISVSIFPESSHLCVCACVSLSVSYKDPYWIQDPLQSSIISLSSLSSCHLHRLYFQIKSYSEIPVYRDCVCVGGGCGGNVCHNEES